MDFLHENSNHGKKRKLIHYENLRLTNGSIATILFLSESSHPCKVKNARFQGNSIRN